MIAKVVLFISIITFGIQRKMTMQSALPCITLKLVDLKERNAINVVNNGVGVAIIKKIKIYNNGCQCDTASLVEEINKISIERKPHFGNAIWKRYDNLKVIAPSRKR